MQQITLTAKPEAKPQRSSLAGRLVHWLLEIDQRHRDARRMQRLSDETLKDIGAFRDGDGRIVRR